MNDILKVENLNKSYGDFSLTDVTFSLPEGCITGFIGINGAGKTTTLRTLLGLTKKDSGNIQFFGFEMERNEKKIKDRIGIVLDDGCFYDELSLAEMKSIISPAYTAWSEQDFKRYIDMFSLDPKQKINTLSKGMKMKYALALALSHNAELLIMDEPTSGLDPLIRSQLLKVLTDYMENGGKGVFFSTHITSDLDKIADMLIMINNGRIIGLLKPKIVLPKVIVDSYSGEELRTVIRHEQTHIRLGHLWCGFAWDILRCLLWINPFLTIFLKAFRADLEDICDIGPGCFHRRTGIRRAYQTRWEPMPVVG